MYCTLLHIQNAQDLRSVRKTYNTVDVNTARTYAHTYTQGHTHTHNAPKTRGAELGREKTDDFLFEKARGENNRKTERKKNEDGFHVRVVRFRSELRWRTVIGGTRVSNKTLHCRRAARCVLHWQRGSGGGGPGERASRAARTERPRGGGGSVVAFRRRRSVVVGGDGGPRERESDRGLGGWRPEGRAGRFPYSLRSAADVKRGEIVGVRGTTAAAAAARSVRTNVKTRAAVPILRGGTCACGGGGARKEKYGGEREKPVQGDPHARATEDPDHSLSSAAGHGRRRRRRAWTVTPNLERGLRTKLRSWLRFFVSVYLRSPITTRWTRCTGRVRWWNFELFGVCCRYIIYVRRKSESTPFACDRINGWVPRKIAEICRWQMFVFASYEF